MPFRLHGEHTVLQPFRHIELIVHIVISVPSVTHLHLSQVKYVRVKCFTQEHNDISLKIREITKQGSKPHVIDKAPYFSHCATSLSRMLYEHIFQSCTVMVGTCCFTSVHSVLSVAFCVSVCPIHF